MTPGSFLAVFVWVGALWAQGGDGGVAPERGPLTPPAAAPSTASGAMQLLERPVTERVAERAVPQVAMNEGHMRGDPTIEAEYRRAEPRLQQCRIEVARRRRVAPSRVAAKSVTLRWTIEPSGRVHDAEALLAPQTDHEVAACAKRVITEWTFAKQTGGPQTIEWTYTFPG
jgi:hypothetical protein